MDVLCKEMDEKYATSQTHFRCHFWLNYAGIFAISSYATHSHWGIASKNYLIRPLSKRASNNIDFKSRQVFQTLISAAPVTMPVDENGNHNSVLVDSKMLVSCKFQNGDGSEQTSDRVDTGKLPTENKWDINNAWIVGEYPVKLSSLFSRLSKPAMEWNMASAGMTTDQIEILQSECVTFFCTSSLFIKIDWTTRRKIISKSEVCSKQIETVIKSD